MQTLIDPFELASRTPPPPLAVVMPVKVAPSFPPPPVRPVALTLADLDVVVEEEPRQRRPGADSSGRLRCWCSED